MQMKEMPRTNDAMKTNAGNKTDGVLFNFHEQ